MAWLHLGEKTIISDCSQEVPREYGNSGDEP